MSTVKRPLTIELSLLGLVRQQPMHPYEIHQRLTTTALSDVWRIKQAHLYALLHRLEDEGLLVGTTENQINRPPRRMLRLTEQGRAAFDEWMRAPVTHGRDFRLEFLAKLYFAHQEGAAATQSLIDQQRNACQRLLDDLDHREATLPTDHVYRHLVVQFRRGQIQAILAWLDACRIVLHAGRLNVAR
jgi:DNA-binding PadR family transcriptional regulator